MSQIPKFIGSLAHLKNLILYGAKFQGQVPHELGNLSQLEHLDLGDNDFNMSQIPKFIGSLAHLKTLILSGANFQGQIPHELGNLSQLEHLDLGYNSFTGKVPYTLGSLTNLQYLDLSLINYAEDPFVLPNKSLKSDLEWLSHLRSLKSLALERVDLSSAHNWLPQVANLSHLQVLRLRDSHLHDSVSLSFSSINIISTTLAVVDLSDNNLTATIHKCFLDICSLQELDLSRNKLSGRLDEFISTSRHCANRSLQFLDLRWNQFTRSVPSFSQFPFLSILFLDENRLNGTVSESIGGLSKLEEFSVAHNSLQGVISEAHFSKLSQLTDLDLSFNALTVDVSNDWVPPFQIDSLNLASCKLGHHFPRWLRTQKSIGLLDISSNAITSPIPNWFWDLGYNLQSLNLSHNQISGEIANLPREVPSLSDIDLNSNMLQGRIPSFLSTARRLDLSNNKFLEANLLICSNKTKYLNFLDLSNNQLTGKLPECWRHFDKLVFLSLANNNFYGNIPSSMGLLTNIEALHLGNNNFMGEIPLSFNNCRELNFFDASKNNLSGPLPRWIGDGLQKLHILILRSNMFNGNLPSNICQLPKLQLLDLSFNDISGIIPKCLDKFDALVSQANSNTTITYYFDEIYNDGSWGSRKYSDSASLIWKGKEVEYRSTLGLVRSIDLSSNNFIGEIPNEITSLTGLVSLNLSRNKLIGEIPPTIGQLKLLDSLDLSMNQLSGRIPSQISQLGFLGVLNLSYNNLSGEIPYIPKLQTFNVSAYMGNPELCGAPLSRCPMKQTNQHDAKDEDEKLNFIPGFYISMIIGFIIGFWGVCGSLILKKSWRYAYFKFFNDLYDKLYVLLAITTANLHKRIKTILRRP